MTEKIQGLLNKYKALMNSAGVGFHKKDNQTRILTYGVHTGPRMIFGEEEQMRVLFVRSSIYDIVCDWYEQLNDIQKHRKTTVICKSPEEFWEKFNKDKFGAQYTTFYFDDRLLLTDTLECFKEIVRLYGEDDARYISENKMRQIDTGYLMNCNNFDCFRGLSVDPECLNDVIRQALNGYENECRCQSLL